MCDTVYLGWVGNLKFSFPDEMLAPIKKAVFGFMGDVANLIENSAKNIYDKAKSKIFNRNDQSVDSNPAAQD